MENNFENAARSQNFLGRCSLLLCGVTFALGNLVAQEVESPSQRLDRPVLEQDLSGLDNTISTASEPPTFSEPPIPPPADTTTPTSSAEAGYVPVESAAVVKHAWDFAAELQTRVTYDDNLFISHDNPQSDVEFAVVPLIAFGLGDVQAAVHREMPFPNRFAESLEGEEARNLILVRYALAATFFADHSSQNRVNHDASAVLVWHFPRLNIHFIGHYQTLSDADVDVGTRVDRTFADTDLGAAYNISDKFSVEAGLRNEIHDYDIGRSAVTWEGETFLDYQIRPKTKLGIGVGGGRLEYDRGDDQTFEQALVRVLYSLTQKISLRARGGLEFREFDSGRDTRDPIFGVGANYSPFDGTTISVGATRDINSSAQITRANTKRTSFSLDVQQRLYQFLYLRLSAGYTNADYEVLPGLVAEARTDDVFYIFPSLGFDITRHAGFLIGYRYWRDDSSLSRFTFTDNEVRVQLNLSY